MTAPGRAGIFACAIARAKKVVVLKSREIAQVAYIGPIMVYWRQSHMKIVKGVHPAGPGYLRAR